MSRKHLRLFFWLLAMTTAAFAQQEPESTQPGVVAASAVVSEVLSFDQLSDPTRPTGWKKAAPASRQPVTKQFTLNYLLISPLRRQAIINGKKVTVGEWVDGARVASITEHEVRLQVDGSLRVLPWRTSGVSKSAR